MRNIRVIVVILFILFLAVPFSETSGQYTLPNYKRTVEYVNALLSEYTNLVNMNYVNRSDFESIKGNFSLYANTGNSFKVIVAQSSPNNSSVIALIFSPIQATQPNVTMDHNDTLNTLFPNTFSVSGEYNLLEHNVLQYGNIVIKIPVIFTIPSSDISSANYLTNAKSAAQMIYRIDAGQVTIHHTFSVTLTEQISLSEYVSVSSQTTMGTTTIVTSTVTQKVPITNYIRPTITITTTTEPQVVLLSSTLGSTSSPNLLTQLVSDLNEIAVQALAIIVAAAVIAILALLGYRSVKKARETGKETWLSKLATELLRDKTVKEEKQPNANVKENSTKDKKPKK